MKNMTEKESGNRGEKRMNTDKKEKMCTLPSSAELILVLKGVADSLW